MLSMDFPSNLLVFLPQFHWLIPFQSPQSWWFFNEISQSLYPDLLISFIKLTEKSMTCLVPSGFKKNDDLETVFFQPIHLRPHRQIGSSPNFPGQKETLTDPMDGNVFNLHNRTVLSCLARLFQFLWKKCTGETWWKKQSSFRAHITTVVST